MTREQYCTKCKAINDVDAVNFCFNCGNDVRPNDLRSAAELNEIMERESK